MEREHLLTILSLLGRIVEKYGNNVDFGKWRIRKNTVGQNIRYEILNDNGEYGYIGMNYGIVIQYGGWSIIEEFIGWTIDELGIEFD